MTSPDVVWQPNPISRPQREQLNGHRGQVIWLTGLPGSGKSTIAAASQLQLHHRGMQTVLLDGDNLRHGLCSDLGFSVADRNENVRRTGAVAKLFLEQGCIVLVALVSPIRSARDALRASMAPGDFLEVWCQCPPSVCATRDPKTHYAQARRGLIDNFTGVSSPYEEPRQPALVLDTASEALEVSVQRLMACLDLS